MARNSIAFMAVAVAAGFAGCASLARSDTAQSAPFPYIPAPQASQPPAGFSVADGTRPVRFASGSELRAIAIERRKWVQFASGGQLKVLGEARFDAIC